MKRKKIVIITSRFPFPLDKGDKLRIYHQIKYLSKYHKIYLIALNTENKITQNQIEELKKYCENVFVIRLSLFSRVINLIQSFLNREPLQVGYFYSKKAHGKITNIIKKIQPDWCYAQLIRTAKYIENEENNIIDYMDALSKGIERRINTFPLLIRPIIKYEFKITQLYEKYIFKKFQKHTIITENDREFITHKNNQKIIVIPNGVDTTYFSPTQSSKKKYDIIFIGNMNYPPNIKAAIFLCEEILPRLEKKYRRCKVLIGGTNPNKRIKKLKNKNIDVSGRVNDIRELYNSGHIFLAPMFIGTGLQNKLLEAMAMGLPCITTSLANDALLANKQQIITADSIENFTNSCVKLLENTKDYKKFQKEGLKFIKKKYDWKKINHKLSELFN